MTEQVHIDFEKAVIPTCSESFGRIPLIPDNAGTGAAGMTDVESAILRLIQRGRENSISMAALAATLDISTRDLQHVIKHLIEDHSVLIASATGRNHGYYYPVTEDELISCRAQIIHRITSLARRLKAIDKEAYEAIFGQKNIFTAEDTE